MPVQHLRHVTWQSENRLSCKWFIPSDPLNADILTNGRCVHPDLRRFDLIVSGRDWCNVFEPITPKQIDALQAKAMKTDAAAKHDGSASAPGPRQAARPKRKRGAPAKRR